MAETLLVCALIAATLGMTLGTAMGYLWGKEDGRREKTRTVDPMQSDETEPEHYTWGHKRGQWLREQGRAGRNGA